MDDVIIRELQTMPEFTALVEMQQAIWGMVRGEATSPYIMNAARHNGGVVLGAEYQGRLVGFCFGFVGWRDGGRLLWSHMAGVLPEYHGRGIGLKLKLAQRQWALDHGHTVISWTFDPMQRGNASFNFHHLGGTASTYYVDYYGEMTDALNAGLASDRLEVRWLLDDARGAAVPAEYDPAAFVLRAGDDGTLLRAPESAFARPVCFIEIPYNISALKRSDMERAQRWQLALRWAMQEALRQGYVVVDFVSQEARGWYVLRRP
jgi:predicted GNAT superfamily acetyltransferase